MTLILRLIIRRDIWIFHSKVFSSGRIRHLKKIILKGRAFRGGSDEKMRRMWFGLENDVVGLPPLAQKNSFSDIFFSVHAVNAAYALQLPPERTERISTCTDREPGLENMSRNSLKCSLFSLGGRGGRGCSV